MYYRIRLAATTVVTSKTPALAHPLPRGTQCAPLVGDVVVVAVAKAARLFVVVGLLVIIVPGVSAAVVVVVVVVV
jgi:hypothetical protein